MSEKGGGSGGGLVVGVVGFTVAAGIFWRARKMANTAPFPTIAPGEPAPSGPSPEPRSQGSSAGATLVHAPGGTWNQIGLLSGIPVFKSANVIAWIGGLRLDDDGDPMCYHPDDWGPLRGRAPKGRDKPENALAKRADLRNPPADWRLVTRWAGVAVGPDKLPIVQGEGDPAPGYWVSTTALGDPSFQSGDPRRYVNAWEIPYISVPGVVLQNGARLGDVAAVEGNGRLAFAILADVGPSDKIGEGSPALARALGLPDDPRRGSDRRGIVTYVFAGSGRHVPLTVSEINALASPLYSRLVDTGPPVA